MNRWLKIVMTSVVAMSLLSLATACGKQRPSVPNPSPSVYYWRTTWALDSTEKAFLAHHKIGKIYLRFFDVVVSGGDSVKPNATLAFADSFPSNLEFIPTVFITEECLRHDINSIVSPLARRVRQMTETHHVPNVGELQIDCDWTKTSMTTYYRFLDSLKVAIKPYGWRLSATIRLHQLSMPAPPVDYGVLMVYNTGDPRDHACRNPILDLDDVKPYLPALDRYPLALAAAYPNFGWDILFSGERYKAILYGADLNDSTIYYTVDERRHLVIQSRYEYQARGGQEIHIVAGDSVLSRLPSPEVIERVHDLLASKRDDINRQVVIYSLDRNNINNYSTYHYEKVFHF